MEQERLVILDEYRTVRQISNIDLVAALTGRARLRALGMHLLIHLFCRPYQARSLSVGDVIRPPAKCTRAVPGGKRHGFVEEKEFGIPMWGHHGAMPVLVFQNTGDPRLVSPASATKFAVILVENAPIAHEHPARRVGNDLARGQNAVLQRHELALSDNAEAAGDLFDLDVAGVECFCQNIDRFPGVGLAAHEDIESAVCQFGPGVHGDMAFCQNGHA